MKILLSSLLAIALLDPDVAPPSGSTGPAKTEVKPAPAPAKTAAAVTFAEGMSTPESVFYDAAADVYLVSNINGAPLAKDNNGYITVIAPDGKATRLVEGGKNKATLNAPKGMAVAGGVLYVTDIDTVRMFDRKTGAPKGELPVAGATFLNDMVVGTDGTTVYFTDSGLKQGAKDFEPSGADGIYAVKGGKVAVVLKDKDLGKPNGLAATADTLWVANFGNNELWSLDLKAPKKGAVTKLPKGSLDGIVMLPNGEVLVSSWEGQAVYRGKPGGEFKQVIGEVSAPADIGYDTKRNQLMVPRFMDNKVEGFSVSVAPPASAR